MRTPADATEGGTVAPSAPVEPTGLVDRVPEGWSVVAYAGRHYGLARHSRAGGRAISVYAEELGGCDVVSANVYRTAGVEVLRPCEMPAEAVVAFLRGWVPVEDR